MEHFKKLYKRTTTGAIQVWWLELSGDKYRTHCGQMDGAIVVSEWTACHGKNEGRANATTPEQQALSEVKAKYVRKRKDGYADTAGEATVSERFSPMLAKDFDDYAAKLDIGACYSQPKLDGIRVIATSTGLFSRKGDRIVSLPHIEDALAPIFEAYENLVIDGEAYSHSLHDNFNTITSLVRKTSGLTSADIEASKQLQFWVYDIYVPENSSMPFAKRQLTYHDLLTAKYPSEFLIPVNTTQISSRDQLDEIYESYMNEGFEGQMVRTQDSPYEQKRTKALLKRKEFVDSEFEVLEILEGAGNASGGAKIAWFRHDKDPGKRFKADVVGTKAERAEILRNAASLVGKMATVKYFKQRTPDDKPRFGKVKLFHLVDRW